MRHVSIDTELTTGGALLESTMATFRRRAVWMSVVAVSAWIAVAVLLIHIVLAPGLAQLALIAGGMAVVAFGSALAVAVSCARWAASIAAAPVELALHHLEAMGEVPATSPHWKSGQARSAKALEEDLRLIDRLFRSAQRRSRVMLTDLAKAQSVAETQNQAKSQFLATMSHELRTPLNAILGYSMLLQEDAEDAGNDAAVADLQRIQQAGRNLLALINDILDLSRIETGKTVVRRSIMDLAALMNEIAAANEEDARRNGNRFVMERPDDLGVIFADRAKLGQCLDNLLCNAFKFTNGGLVTLSVRKEHKGAFPAIVFSIHDTGIGIGEEVLNELFEPFEQAEDVQTRQFGGTGIGLAITRRLARMMGGDCWAESQPGEGSTFYLMIPQDGHDDDSLPATREPVAHYLASHGKSRNKTILVIEDDDDSRQLMQRWLDQMGFNMLAASDSETGLACARDALPDLILLDALMPGQSGYDVLRALRADDRTANIPVVIITVDDDARRGLDAGASDYIRKPILKDELRSLVEVYCGKVSGEVLVIDDDEDAADLIGRSVREVGFTSRHALSGLDGLAMARESCPRAIVLDLTMPGLDGFGVIDRLRNDPGLRAVPLIVLSGRRISSEEHRQLVASGHRYFVKGSSTPRQIAQTLKELVA